MNLGARILLALGVIAASLVALPYVLRAAPGLPWESVRLVFVGTVIAAVVAADRVYARLRRKPRPGA